MNYKIVSLSALLSIVPLHASTENSSEHFEQRLSELENELKKLKEENTKLKASDSSEVESHPSEITEYVEPLDANAPIKIMTIEKPQAHQGSNEIDSVHKTRSADDDVINDDDDILYNPEAEKPLKTSFPVKKPEQPKAEEKSPQLETKEHSHNVAHEDSKATHHEAEDDEEGEEEEEVRGHNAQETAVKASEKTPKKTSEKVTNKDTDEKSGLDKETDTFKGKEESFLPDGNEQEDYEKAMELLSSKEYADAEAAFKQFIKLYPKSNLVINAKYWLGETYYVRKDYKNSSIQFAEAYQKYSAINKTKPGKEMASKKTAYAKGPEALVKLALSLKGLGKKEDACVALEQLNEEFKKIPNNVKKMADKAKQGLKCN